MRKNKGEWLLNRTARLIMPIISGSHWMRLMGTTFKWRHGHWQSAGVLEEAVCTLHVQSSEQLNSCWPRGVIREGGGDTAPLRYRQWASSWTNLPSAGSEVGSGAQIKAVAAGTDASRQYQNLAPNEPEFPIVFLLPHASFPCVLILKHRVPALSWLTS